MVRCRMWIGVVRWGGVSSEMVVVRRVAVETASHVGAHAWKREGMGLYCRRFSVLELLEVVLEVLAAQGAKAGVDSIVSRLASIRGRVHVGLGSGQELCIRSDWSNVVLCGSAGRETRAALIRR